MDKIKKETLLVLSQVSGGILIPKINNSNIVDIYEKYKTEYDPSKWIFSIWPILYFSLIYGFYKQNNYWNRKSETYFELVTISNLSWVYFWTKDKIILSGMSFIPLCISLYKLIEKNLNNEDIFLQNTLTAYLSWAIIAGSLNLASILKYKSNLKNYKKIIGFILCFSQICFIIKQRSIKNDADRKIFNKNTYTYPLIGFIAILSLRNNTGIKKELFSYLLCCFLSCVNQLN